MIDALTIYGASKAALERATTGLACELSGSGICANSLAPTAMVLTQDAKAFAGALAETHPEQVESMETMVEAALALCQGSLTGLSSCLATCCTCSSNPCEAFAGANRSATRSPYKGEAETMLGVVVAALVTAVIALVVIYRYGGEIQFRMRMVKQFVGAPREAEPSSLHASEPDASIMDGSAWDEFAMRSRLRVDPSWMVVRPKTRRRVPRVSILDLATRKRLDDVHVQRPRSAAVRSAPRLEREVGPSTTRTRSTS